MELVSLEDLDAAMILFEHALVGKAHRCHRNCFATQPQQACKRRMGQGYTVGLETPRRHHQRPRHLLVRVMTPIAGGGLDGVIQH